MERKEPTLSGIVPERDDDSLDKVAPQAERPQASSKSGASRRRTPPPPPPASNGGASFLAIFALVLAIGSLGYGGYLTWKFTEAQKELVAAQNRVTNLEARLDLNSNESSETVDEIRDKLDWADSEIRKLWGVSHDTNRKKITANGDAIAALKKQLAATEKDAATARASANNIKAELEKRMAAMDKQLAASSAELQKSQRVLQDLAANGERLQSLSMDVQRVSQQLPGLKDLAARVKANEEAIAAIDAYRRSINRDILQLKQSMGGTTASP
ncbi:hypothetical protein [Gilvimarinus chinensis]|uniref:hypothetical protein n=1 Tax=Gilvimarinus chinensis TaxID=396005 RepID=UPI00037746B5|nr:hypothetical protein [Gilvimarinus chinensis]